MKSESVSEDDLSEVSDHLQMISAKFSCQTIVLTCFVCVLLKLVFTVIKWKGLKKELSLKVLDKNAENAAAKEKLKKTLLQADELILEKYRTIVQQSLTELLESLQQNRFTAVEVLKAFQLKALEVDEKTNCITQFIDDALHWAEQLDKATKKGPLHGLPVSVKDNASVKGMDCTLGLVKFLGKPVKEDAVLVKMLKDAGAVPFVKTNVPQTLLSYNCENPVFGTTKNPYDPSRTTGGSSGGECALIALGGSVFGLGSDIGGSVRIPANMCGVCGLKPTAGRLSGKNMKKSVYGVQGVYGTGGPITRDVDGLLAVSRVFFAEQSYNLDHQIVPIPFNEKLLSENRALRIGYYDDDGFYPCTPGCRRAVDLAKNSLEAIGYELIKFKVPDPWKAYKLAMKLLLADGGSGLQKAWKDDLVDKSMLVNQTITSLPACARKLIAAFVKLLSPRLAVVVGETGRSAEELWQAMVEREDYIDLFLSEWDLYKLDGLLCPGFPFPAPPHDYPTKLAPACFATMLYNFLNFPVGCLPITQENNADQENLSTYPEDDILFKLTKKCTKGAVGLPLGVQIVGLPWQEEKVLRIMKELENARLKFPDGSFK